MDYGLIAASTSLFSTVVIAITAVAAFRQLRHYRNANDIVVYLRLIDRMDSSDMQDAREALREIGERVRTDDAFRARMSDPTDRLEEMQAVGALLRFLEHISVLVIKGGIAESLILAEYAELFVEMWQHGRQAIVARRAVFGPHTARAFEHLAMRSQHYIDSGEMAREYDALARDPLTPE